MYPSELANKETDLIRDRRAMAGVANEELRIGVACSGGGIRSATVCLGVFQALAHRGLLPRLDYISTISGGGYFGSFLGSLYLPRPRTKSVKPQQIPQTVAKTLADNQSAPIRWLRKHGRYIAPNGPADYANIVAIYIRNWVGVHYVIGITFLTLFLLLLLIRSLTSAHVLPLLAKYGDFAPESWPPSLSPFLVVPLLILLLVSAPVSWSFWLTQYGADRSGVEMDDQGGAARALPTVFRNNKVFWATLFVLVVCAGGWFAVAAHSLGRTALEVVLLIGLLALGYWMVAEILVAGKRDSATPDQALPLRRRHALVRNLLSDNLGVSLKALAATAAIGIIDSLAKSAYDILRNPDQHLTIPVAVSGAVTALLALVHQLAPYLQHARDVQSRWSWWTIASIAGLVVMGLIVLLWDLVTYAIVFRGSPVAGDEEHTRLLCGYLAIGIVLVVFTAQTLTFLNLSSLQAFYSARLRRAYLGASNPRRTGYDCTGTATTASPPPQAQLSIRREAEGDDSSWADYTPERFGGPLHLLGVTVNHTIGRGSDIDLRDRKGFTMTMGPAGVSAAIDSHALLNGQTLRPLRIPDGRDPMFGKTDTVVRPEPCPLSRWVGISGAAFSTGLGANTRTGVSVLLGSANVRLGYWWASGAQADTPKSLLLSLFRTQAYLYDEFLGRFAGAGYRHWYLSDGGHSENTGAYELIRRRVPFIVLLDNGADPNYEFEDFGNLVRRVRIDFGAEITPLSTGECASRDPSGQILSATGLSGLRRTATGPMGVALAQRAVAAFKVTYGDGVGESLLILAKPTLVGDEAEDVTNYARTHEAFPQEPTSDQFFDEAQWESYRRLGEHVGGKICGLPVWGRQ